MKRVRKVLVMIMALTMMMGSMRAVASPSVTIPGIITGIDESTDSSGTTVYLGVRPVTEPNVPIVDLLKDEEVIKSALTDDYKEGLKVIDAKEVFVVGDSSLISWPVKVKFIAEVIKSNDKVKVLYYNGSEWTKCTAEAYDGMIHAVIDNTGVFAFLLDAAASPKTDDGMQTVAVMALMAMAACGLMMIGYKRRRA